MQISVLQCPYWGEELETSRVNPLRKYLSFVPARLPDQTLYSWVTMFHVLSGNASNELTKLQIYGSAKAGRHFHIPSHLDAFCASTQHTLGTPEQVVADATVISYFTRFRSPTVARDTLIKLRGEHTAGVPQLLGMGKTGPFSTLLCRRCSACMREDKSDFNFSYWHRSHQLPGVLVCHKHGNPLMIAQLETERRFHSRFILPEFDLIRKSALQVSGEVISHATLYRLAVLAKEIADANFMGGHDQVRMQRACKAALRNRFPLASSAKYDPLKVAAAYNNHFHDVASAPELQAVLCQRGTHALWCLLEAIECRVHPLEWMLIIDWLFGSWDEFVASFSASGD